ncbi:MAG: SGNH/GDSL hydrolase family protein [Clostridia bacterium]|nr:SGNH/GDSL hydrolase family protein [Clostridia bacterium]
MKKIICLLLCLALFTVSCDKNGVAETESKDIAETQEDNLIRTTDGMVYEKTGDSGINFTGRWFEKEIGGALHRVTVNDGSEFQFAVSGTETVTVVFTVITSLKTPYYAYMIDGSDPERKHITDGDISLPDTGDHVIRIITDGITESESKYKNEIGFAFRDIDAHGGTVIGIKPLNKTVMFMGDSITEGVRALSMDADSDGNSATHSYPWYCASRLGAIAINCGFAASGTVGAGSFAPFLDTVNRFSETRENSMPAPDVIVINYGHNDVYFKESDVTPRYNAALDALRTKYPDAPIFVLIPFSQTHADTIRECCAGRDYITVVETNGWNPSTTDGIHLNALGANSAGTRLAAEIKRVLGEDFFSVGSQS